uniref:Uncharacterized protein n=1 Tax=Lygus hesperus TaxID=30085 RepID=A0A0A9VUV4_LYGHE
MHVSNFTLAARALAQTCRQYLERSEDVGLYISRDHDNVPLDCRIIEATDDGYKVSVTTAANDDYVELTVPSLYSYMYNNEECLAALVPRRTQVEHCLVESTKALEVGHLTEITATKISDSQLIEDDSLQIEVVPHGDTYVTESSSSNSMFDPVELSCSTEIQSSLPQSYTIITSPSSSGSLTVGPFKKEVSPLKSSPLKSYSPLKFSALLESATAYDSPKKSASPAKTPKKSANSGKSPRKTGTPGKSPKKLTTPDKRSNYSRSPVAKIAKIASPEPSTSRRGSSSGSSPTYSSPSLTTPPSIEAMVRSQIEGVQSKAKKKLYH